MGTRYLLFRVGYLFQTKLGLLQLKIPHKRFSASSFRSDLDLGFKPTIDFDEIRGIPLSSDTFQSILNGEIKFFNSTWFKINDDYDWRTNLETGFSYPLKHWSKINDFDKKAGDIKYVWEPSRFSWALEILRLDKHTSTNHSEFIFNRMDSWIKSNPINLGPNYKCSQEMSLRIWNWSIILDFYANSESLTEKRLKVYRQSISGHLDHIFKNISFSRIAVRNNHAITETGVLFLSRWLFPYVPNVERWSKKAEKWFYAEIEYQIYPDGSFLQFSMNYHRVVVQTLTGVISTALKNNYELDRVVYNRAYASINFLYSCMGNDSLGLLPNYGQNDGALFFPWTGCDYRDYRPQINALHFCLTGEDLFQSKEIIEERMWWGSMSLEQGVFAPLKRKEGFIEFENGGYLVYRGEDVFLFFRNGNYLDRPSQADNHHIDLWYKGENILMDSGTFKYNTSVTDIKWFMGSMGHNVAQLDDYDQMLKGGRFIWYHWSQSKHLQYHKLEKSILIEGVISAFKYLNKDCQIKRQIELFPIERVLKVRDEVLNFKDYRILHQNWHYHSNVHIQTNYELSIQEGECSSYYGLKAKNQFARVSSTSNIVESQISF